VEEVIVFKRPVKMNKREMPHRHGKRMMAGGYPINAAKEFLLLLKQLKSNATFNELEIEKYVLFCKADKASRPYRSGGRRFKRSHVILKLVKKPEVKK
jgi:ribosomal protein L22